MAKDFNKIQNPENGQDVKTDWDDAMDYAPDLNNILTEHVSEAVGQYKYKKEISKGISERTELNKVEDEAKTVDLSKRKPGEILRIQRGAKNEAFFAESRIDVAGYKERSRPLTHAEVRMVERDAKREYDSIKGKEDAYSSFIKRYGLENASVGDIRKKEAELLSEGKIDPSVMPTDSPSFNLRWREDSLETTRASLDKLKNPGKIRGLLNKLPWNKQKRADGIRFLEGVMEIHTYELNKARKKVDAIGNGWDDESSELKADLLSRHENILRNVHEENAVRSAAEKELQ